MISLLLLVPLTLVALAQLIAVVALPLEAHTRALPMERYLTSWALYALGLAGAVTSLVIASGPLAIIVPLILVTTAAVIAGPFLWGRAIGEFHLSHHIVRASLLVTVIVFYFWYVALHR